ncbi:MAG: HD domain-containing response regulator [Clostridia bacterium]
MRITKLSKTQNRDYRIIIVDDDQGIIDSLSSVLIRQGYMVTGILNPLEAIEIVKAEHFDLIILDYLMSPIHGDKVVEEIREFNKEIYILMLTGHKDLAPPLETIKKLAIQGYCEKSDRFDQIILLVESGVKSITQMRTIKKFSEGLNRILQSVPNIYQLQPIGDILEQILRELLPLLDSEHAFILVDNYTDVFSQNDKSIYKGIGKYDVEIAHFMEHMGHDKFEQIGISRVKKVPVNMEDGIILPLVNEYGSSMGVIFAELGHGDIEEGLKLLRIYCSQAASSINNAFLHSMVNEKNDELSRTYDMLKERYLDTIEALRLVVDAKDIYTRGHSDRVSFYALKVGQRMGLDEKSLETLRIGGLFHDVGKIGTSDDLLAKKEKLTYLEYEEIKKHPVRGAHILSAVSMFKEIVPIIKFHHERLDGTGYPDGLKGESIPLLTRIISVVDAFDAMMSDRQYREKLGFQTACSELSQYAGTQFDKDVVHVFLDLVNNQKDFFAEAKKYEIQSLKKSVH